jgi:ACS family hexuronate transporter-like MFS transporter
MMLATLLNYMDRQILPQIATELKITYHLDDARYGTIARNFAWAFAVGSIVFGFLADRIGPRLLYPFVLLGWSVAGLATPLMRDATVTLHFQGGDPESGPYHFLLMCRTLLGFFEAGHWPCALLTARQILTAPERPLGNGLLQSGAALGAILVPLYVLAVRTMGGGWEVVFWTIGAAGLLWVPIWLGLVRHGDLAAGVPGGPSSAGQAAHDTPSAGLHFEWLPFIRIYVALFTIIVGLNVSWQFIREWLPKYLMESQRFSADAADTIVPVYYISAELGCFTAGVLVRRLVTRGREVHSARVRVYALFALLSASAALAPLVGGWSAVALIVVAGAGILGLHPLYYALSQELPAKSMALLSGILAAAGWFAVGAVQEAMGVRIKETGSYAIGLYIAGLAPLPGLLALLLLWKSAELPNPLSTRLQEGEQVRDLLG